MWLSRSVQPRSVTFGQVETCSALTAEGPSTFFKDRLWRMNDVNRKENKKLQGPKESWKFVNGRHTKTLLPSGI
jgi:hypothetical protein